MKPSMALHLYMTLRVIQVRIPKCPHWVLSTRSALDAPNPPQLSLITGLTKCIISSNNLIVPVVAILSGCHFDTGRENLWSYLSLGRGFLVKSTVFSVGRYRCSSISLSTVYYTGTQTSVSLPSVSPYSGHRDLRGAVDVFHKRATHGENRLGRKCWTGTLSGKLGTGHSWVT